MDRRTDGRTDDPITRCPRRTFQAGGIKILVVPVKYLQGVRGSTYTVVLMAKSVCLSHSSYGMPGLAPFMNVLF